MKALIYYGPHELRLEDREMPSAGEQDVVVKIQRAGICGSDLTAYLYDGLGVGILKKGQFGHDGQFGHEMAGVVKEVGKKVQNIKEGDRVFINPTNCKRSGMLGCDIAGAFSEYVLVEDASYGKNLMKLADDVTFDEAVTIEPLAVGTHGKNCVNVKPYENVVIYGAGMIGICTLNALTAMGCRKVTVIDQNRQRLDVVSRMGAVPYAPEEGLDLKGFLVSQYGASANSFGVESPDVDVFIDCAGAKPILAEIIGMAKEHARVSIVAVHKQPVEISPAEVLSRQLTMKGSCGYEMFDVKEAFNNINAHRTRVPEIVNMHFPHEQAVEAFKTAADPASGAIKVVIDYED